MEKRFFLAIALAALVLFAWSALFHKQGPKSQLIENNTVTPDYNSEPSPALKLKEAQTENLTLENYDLVFTPSRAGIKEIAFKKYHEYVLPLEGLYFENLPPLFVKEKLAEKSVFIYQDNEKKIIQEYDFSNPNYSIELSIRIKNLTPGNLDLNLPFVLNRVQRPSGAEGRFQSQEAVISLSDKTQHLSPWREINTTQDIRYIAFRERYFCVMLKPENLKTSAFIKKIDSKESALGINLHSQVIPQQEVTLKFLIYLGPQDLKLINKVDKHAQDLVYFGFFDPISKVLLNLLRFIERITHNWGVSIIILSLLVYFILFPLSLQQMRSMKEMQILQPKIEELKKAYKDNPQKMNKAMMELYKEHKINPFGGCLPLVLQIPVFFSLYQALMRSLELKGANFLWIKDLSAPDRLFSLPVSLPIIGNEFNLLPILMSIGMFFQQKLTSKMSVSSEQKMMLILFPLLFGFIFYHMPSGLVLYWFINSLLMLILQLKPKL